MPSDSYEMNRPVWPKNIPTHVPWWNIPKLRFGVLKQFNRARKTNTLGDWERFMETQRIYKKATVVIKRNSYKTWRVPQMHLGFKEFLAKNLTFI